MLKILDRADRKLFQGAGEGYIWPIMKIDSMMSVKDESEIYQLLFTSSIILILPKVISGQRSAGAVFSSPLSKMTIILNSNLSSPKFYIFWAVILKLSGYVLTIKINILASQNFDLGL